MSVLPGNGRASLLLDIAIHPWSPGATAVRMDQNGTWEAESKAPDSDFATCKIAVHLAQMKINNQYTYNFKRKTNSTCHNWISLSEWSLTSILKAWTTQMCWHPGVTDHLGRWCPSVDAEGGERERWLEEVGWRVKLHLDHLCHQVFKKKWWLRGGLLHTSSEECLTDTNFEKQPWGPSHPNRPLRHLDGL